MLLLNFKLIIESGVIMLNPPEDMLPDIIINLSVSMNLYSSNASSGIRILKSLFKTVQPKTYFPPC